MAAHGVGIGVLTRYPVLLGDVLGRHAHVVVVEDVPQSVVYHVVEDVRLGHPHPVAVAALVQQERRPVHVHARDLDGEAALYADLTTGVHALARGEDVADYYLVDLVDLDPRAREDLFADRGPEFRRRRVLERTAEGPYTRPEGRRDYYLAVTVAEAHLFSFRLYLNRGYIKREGPDHTTRASI